MTAQVPARRTEQGIARSSGWRTHKEAQDKTQRVQHGTDGRGMFRQDKQQGDAK